MSWRPLTWIWRDSFNRPPFFSRKDSHTNVPLTFLWNFHKDYFAVPLNSCFRFSKDSRGAFRTLSNILVGAFYETVNTFWSQKYFCKKPRLKCLTEFWIFLWTAILQENTLSPEVAVYWCCPEHVLQKPAKFTRKHLW